MESRGEKKVEKVLGKIGVSSSSEIVSSDQLSVLIGNLSKLPAESLQQLVENIPNFTDLSRRYLDDIKSSHDNYSDRLEREMERLYGLLEADIKGLDKADILQEIRVVRDLLRKDRLLNSAQANAVYGAGIAVVSVVATVAVKRIKS